MPLTDRASVRRAVYRLANLSDDDGALVEHDLAQREAINLSIYDGINDAQEWMLRSGYPDPWFVIGTVVVVAGVDTDAAGKYIALETDFLRLFGDEDASAFYNPSNKHRQWGRQLTGAREGRGRTGDHYWLEGDRIRLAQGSNPPAGLVYDYIREATEPEDGTAIDFPERERGLVAAWAAMHSAANDYLPGGEEMATKIARNLRVRRSQTWKRARRTRQGRKMRRPGNAGQSTHWLLMND